MRFFCVDIAGITIGIKASFTRIYNICKDFIVEDAIPAFIVQCTEEDFDQKAIQYEEQNKHFAPSDVYLEEYCMLEKISEELIDYGIFLLHGVAIYNDERGIIFTAKSGTGKTTHALKWLENCPDAYIINGDKPFIKISSNEDIPIVCGSPWAGKEGLGRNSRAPLTTIVLMERAENNSIRKISFSEAFLFLYQQVYRSNDEKKMRKTLKLLQSLQKTVSFYSFSFNNMKDDCFQVAYDAVMESEK